MSVFTTELRYICEAKAGLTASTSGYEAVITKAAPLIFNFDFPFYSEGFRLEWEKNFLRHFYTREIGAETYGLWHLWLNDRLVTIMPKYNEMYKVVAEKYDPLITDYMTETGSDSYTNRGSSQGTNSGRDSGSSKVTDRRSDTPQGTIDDLESNQYLSEAEISDSTDTRTSSSENALSSTAEHAGTDSRTRQGRSGRSAADLLREYRNKMDNVDMLIYQECEDLFMQYYGGVY